MIEMLSVGSLFKKGPKKTELVTDILLSTSFILGT